MKASIILPNYIPDEEVMSKALAFVDSFVDPLGWLGDAEVIVIDNGTDSYKFDELRKSFYGRTISYLPWTSLKFERFLKPIGYARATNIGLALAEGDYLFVLSNDLILPKGWMERMIAEYDRLGPGVLSPMHGDLEPMTDESVRTHAPNSVAVYYEDSWYALWMTDRKTFQKVGYFDETMPYRFMDQDYSIRMKQAGFKVLRTGAVVVGHPEEASTHKKMGIDETPEMARMMQKHGVTLFRDWLQKQVK